MNRIKFSIFCFLFSFFSFAYQMLMAKIVMVEIGHEIIAFCGTTALFFYGMSLGNFRLKKHPPRDFKIALIRTEILMATLAFLGANCTLFLFAVARWNLQNLDSAIYYTFFNFSLFIAFLFSILLGYLAGRELTLLEGSFHDRSSSKSFSQLMFLSYVGAFAAGISLIVILVPTIGSLSAIHALTFLHLLSVCFLIARPRLIFIPLVGLGFLNVNVRSLEQAYAKIGYLEYNQAEVGDGITSFFDSLNDLDSISVTRIHSQYQAIDLIHRKTDKSFGLFLNYNYQFDSRYEQSYHSAILDLFDIYRNKAGLKVLLLGAGDGLMARDLLKRSTDIDFVTLVELDPQILWQARNNQDWLSLNENSLANPKVRVIEGDAFSYIRGASEKWDVVIIDFPYPTSFDISRLYTVEFYQSVLDVLDSNGFFIFDFPLREHADTIFSTLNHSAVTWHLGVERGETFVIGSKRVRNEDQQLQLRNFKIIHPSQFEPSSPNTLDKPVLPRFM